MIEKRRFQRNTVPWNENEPARVQVIVDGKFVRLVNYSIGGLYVISEKPFPANKVVKLSLETESRREIDFTGKIVRTASEPDNEKWGIAIRFIA